MLFVCLSDKGFSLSRAVAPRAYIGRPCSFFSTSTVSLTSSCTGTRTAIISAASLEIFQKAQDILVAHSQATHVRGRRGGFGPYRGGIKDLGPNDARYEFPSFLLWAPRVQENPCKRSGGRCGLFVGIYDSMVSIMTPRYLIALWKTMSTPSNVSLAVSTSFRLYFFVSSFQSLPRLPFAAIPVNVRIASAGNHTLAAYKVQRPAVDSWDSEYCEIVIQGGNT